MLEALARLDPPCAITVVEITTRTASRLGKSTHDVIFRIYRGARPELSEEDAESWLLKQKGMSDIFG